MFVYKNASPLYNAEVQSALQTTIAGTTGIVNPPGEALKFELNQNYPNPFNPVTNIKFTVPKDGHASLNIYDITGKLVATYLNDYVTKGVYNAEIDGTNLSSGVYFYTLKTNGLTDTKKMILIK
jgi:flagellar hook assembly protein FlgD